MTATTIACESQPMAASLKLDALPFSRIPQQSRLFLDYLENAPNLTAFYPSAVKYHHQLSDRVPEVLRAYSTDRAELCATLESQNRHWGAGAATLENIARLRAADCVAIVTGQQAGLLTGALYTIYKALSAVKLTACMRERNVNAVPVFWIATEDHDFAEVAHTDIISCECKLARVGVSSSIHTEGTPVGSVRLDESIEETLEAWAQLLPDSEFKDETINFVRTHYRPGEMFGDAFARMLTALLDDYGLILLDPLDSKLKHLAAPLYAEAARRAPELARALELRSRELEAAGYHAQVLTTEHSFPLFISDEDGARRALARNSDGAYQIKGQKAAYTPDTLAQMALEQPADFSPNVTLRAVVQDYLLPTLAYFGGAAEVAYFAQTSEVYRLLGRPVTPILPRASLTIVERRTARALERYDLKFEDLFEGYDEIAARVVEEFLGKESAYAFNQTELNIARELNALQQQLEKVEPTLAEALETGRRKIQYQLDGLRARFHKAQLKRDDAAVRQLERAFAALYPEKALQERHINITSLLARHGQYVTRWIYDAIHLGNSAHQIVYL